MQPRVYIETTIIGYLTIRPTANVVLAANQQITREWWEARRSDFQLFSSDAVREEVTEGDPQIAEERLAIYLTLRKLDLTEAVGDLAERLLREGPLPEKAMYDAIHIAVAAVHGVHFLLTWNCKHIANAAMRPSIERLCRLAGFEPPIMCTPQELLDG